MYNYVISSCTNVTKSPTHRQADVDHAMDWLSASVPLRIPKAVLLLVATPLLVLAMLAVMTVDFLTKHLVPSIRKRVKAKAMKRVSIKEDAQLEAPLNFEFLKVNLKRLYRDVLYQEAYVGKAAPNVQLINFSTKSACSLMDLVQGKRPLVLNFGSCT